MKVRLIYSPHVVEKPVLSEVILNTKLPINILEAKVNAQKGELIVSIPMQDRNIDRVLAIFKKSGVHVQLLTKTLQIDYDRCTSCGACISPCPTKALFFDSDWSLKFKEEKCVACKICVYACPVKAINPL